MPRGGSKTCKLCHKTFTCSRSLTRHQIESCKGKDHKTKWQCSKCMSYYSSKYNLNRHNDKCTEEELILSPVKPKKHRLNITIEKRTHTKSYEELVIGNLGDNLIDILQEKQGQDNAINFLLDNFLAGYFIKIIDECYLNGKNSDQIPIATCDGKHYRYLDGHNDLINDPTGDLAIAQIINNIQNAVLRTSNILIRRYINEESQETLYDDYDVRKIQDKVCSIQNRTTKNKIKKYLSTRVLNASHSFFENGNNLVNLGTVNSWQYKLKVGDLEPNN